MCEQVLIQQAFEQWGCQEKRVVKDPVTGAPTGIVAVQLSQASQVGSTSLYPSLPEIPCPVLHAHGLHQWTVSRAFWDPLWHVKWCL